MKKSVLILVTLFLGMVAYSQRKSDSNRPIKKDNFTIDITYDALTNHPKDVSFYFGSGICFQTMIDLKLNSKVFNGAFGIGYTHSNYYNNGYAIHTDSILGDYTTFLPIPADSSYKRSKYVTNYFDIPFELRYRSIPNDKGHSWKAAVGFKIGLRLGSRTQTKTSQGKYADFIQPNLTKTRYGLTARFGYGRVGLFGYYGLTTLFEKGKGHEMIPMSLGITISPF